MESPKLIPSVAIPEIRVGKTTVSGKGWVTIPFGYTFQKNPSVICIAEGRAGSYQPLQFTPPEIPLPQIESITPPTINLPDLGTLPTLPTSFKKLVTNLPVFQTQLPTDLLTGVDKQHNNLITQLGANPLLRPMLGFQDFIYKVFMRPIINFIGASIGAVVDYVVGLLLTEFDEKAYKPLRGKVDELAQALGGKVTETRTAIESGINKSLEIIAGGTNEALSQFHTGVQTAVNETSAQATAALNQSIDLLWTTLGLEEGTLMSPINIQNVTPSGFDVWGLGGDMTLHWISATGLLVENGNGDGLPDWMKNLPEWLQPK